jgi:phenylacetate-coenzyme A ligase PaaK-like adenylate-forming protein
VELALSRLAVATANLLINAQEQFEDRQVRAGALQPFLRHICRRVPFYVLNRIEGAADTGDLRPFPLVSRKDLSAAPKLFRSRGRRNGFCGKSSGTTGPPLTVEYDLAAWYEDNQYVFHYLDLKIPTRGKTGEGTVMLLSDKPGVEESVSILPACGFRRFDVTTAQSLREHPRSLSHVVVLHARPSVILRHGALLRSCRLRPREIICSGEPLYQDLRLRLERQFCPVRNVYASTEGGVVAVECARRRLHVLPTKIVEVLNSSGAVARTGTGELVLTNPINWRTAIVRYRTGDFGTVNAGFCACGRTGTYLRSFRAREPLRVSCGDRAVATSLLAKDLTQLGLVEFQLISTPPTLSLQYSGRRIPKRILGRSFGGSSSDHLSHFTVIRVPKVFWVGRKNLRIVAKPELA